jgi:hypothetical protein
MKQSTSQHFALFASQRFALPPANPYEDERALHGNLLSQTYSSSSLVSSLLPTHKMFPLFLHSPLSLSIYSDFKSLCYRFKCDNYIFHHTSVLRWPSTILRKKYWKSFHTRNELNETYFIRTQKLVELHKCTEKRLMF